MISEEKLDEWERIANAATPGPWRFTRGSVVAIASPKDKRFISVAREAVPALIARVRQLEKEADWLASHVRSGVSTCVDTAYGVEDCTSECIKCWREAAKQVAGDTK